MDCHEAREILQSMYDGDQRVAVDQAQQHIQQCVKCQEWKSDMDTLVNFMSSSLSELPEIDISAAVMSKLPARHPAAVVQTKWSLNRTLVWTLACWFAGAIVLVGGVGIWMLATGTDGLGLVSGICKTGTSILRWSISQIGIATIALKALWNAGGLLLSHLLEIAQTMKWTLVLVFVVDVFLLTVGITALRRKVWSRSIMMI